MIIPSVVIFMQWFNRMERTSGDAAPAEARLPA